MCAQVRVYMFNEAPKILLFPGTLPPVFLGVFYDFWLYFRLFFFKDFYLFSIQKKIFSPKKNLSYLPTLNFLESLLETRHVYMFSLACGNEWFITRSTQWFKRNVNTKQWLTYEHGKKFCQRDHFFRRHRSSWCRPNQCAAFQNVKHSDNKIPWNNRQ